MSLVTRSIEAEDSWGKKIMNSAFLYAKEAAEEMKQPDMKKALAEIVPNLQDTPLYARYQTFMHEIQIDPGSRRTLAAGMFFILRFRLEQMQERIQSIPNISADIMVDHQRDFEHETQAYGQGNDYGRFFSTIRFQGEEYGIWAMYLDPKWDKERYQRSVYQIISNYDTMDYDIDE